MREAPPLRRGDRVAVVAPSSPFELDRLERGMAWVRETFVVRDAPGLYQRRGYLAGEDVDRGAALAEALEDPEVRAVLCARGGYGAMRALEVAGDRCLAALRADPKLIVGFSDITALHAMASRAGVRSLHAPMVVAAGESVTDDHAATLATLLGARPATWEDLDAWAWPDAPAVRGVMVGGNLTVLASLLGTPWFPRLDGALLMLEDVGEKPYRVDRALTALRLSGALSKLAGVVLGGFTRCEPNADGVTVEDVLRERLCDLGVAVVAGAPFGHGGRHAPWVQGAAATLTPTSLAHDEAAA